MKWRKKPVVIDAVIYDGSPESLEAIHYLGLDPVRVSYRNGDGGELIIPTLEGDHIASVGDYIIRGVVGELYPCKPEIFLATYERVE